ncbi:unnamed protein product, partial [Hapterophycus canaliculatus]
DELDENDFRAKRKNGSNRDDGTDPDVLAPDLLAACKENNVKRVRDLLDDGAPPAYSDPTSGWSCLHWSVYNGNPVLTRVLVRAGAASGYKRASITLIQARERMFRTCCARRAPTPHLPITDTPLHWSAYRGDLGITWILLREGYSPNDTDNMGNTATHLAAANGHERVLDTLIRDGSDVHQQNKFKNTAYDVANSAKCREILKRAEALPPPSVEDAEKMHHENLQRILEVERVLMEVVGSLEPTDDENRRRNIQTHQERDARPARAADAKDVDRQGGGEGQGEKVGGVGGDHSRSKGNGEVRDRQDNKGKWDDDATRGGEDEVEDGGNCAGAVALDVDAAARNGAEGGAGEGGRKYEVAGGARAADQHDLKRFSDESDGGDPGGLDDQGDNEEGEDRLAQVERLRDAVAGAEALCICEDLVAAARLKIDGLLLQHSIEQQAARIVTEGPILTQHAYTTLVNRLMLLLRRAEDNSRISGKLKRRAKALVDKSHGEYWLQVSAQRFLKVECAEARHVPEMAKLEACIEK